MIPDNTILNTEIELETMPSKEYKVDLLRGTIVGVVDGLEAIKQTISKILNTERYDHIIYSWNYGVELKDLLGKPVDYVCPELERRITEALLQDDRINFVDSFSFDTSQKRKVVVSFTVHTVLGDIPFEKEANY